MKRTWWFLLGALVVALAVGPDNSAPVTATPATSVRLTAQETDCIVGGQVGCLSEMVESYVGCVGANFDPERPETATAFAGCGAVGLWTGVVCAVTSIWNWIFGK